MSRLAYIAVAVVLGIGAVFFLTAPQDSGPSGPVAASEIAVPATLSEAAATGQTIFEAKCISCHGENGSGVEEAGPPLIHKVYEPSHHGDEAFQLAVQQGVRQHHWPYGNMPAVEGLTRGDVMMIVAYVRAVQQANGIE